MRYRRASKINIYNIDGYEDYYYGFMVPSTGYLDRFQLKPLEEGFVLTIPEVEGKTPRVEYKASEMIGSVLKQAEDWGSMMNINNIGALNNLIVAGHIDALILVQEALMEKQIADIAAKIAEEKRQIILIAGPSSSGKTTFSNRLSVQLAAHGLFPHPVAMDDFFKERVDTPKDADGNEDTSKEKSEDKLKIKKRPVALNDTTPLWAKHPNECTKDEYLDFYRKVFHDYKEPLFWIHLNMDYPFNLKGILYFPRINMEFESIEGVIKLYNNQVFIADNIKEVIPEYLMLLKGVIDCPDLPLNVSRSALQNDGFVKKISEYISKKVADKLAGMCKTEREEYEKYWDDISPFIKYGCLKDDKFCEKMTDYILFKDIDSKYMTLPECLEVKPIDTEEGESEENAVDEDGNKVEAEIVSDDEKKSPDDEAEAEESKEKKIFYVTDMQQQSQYVNMFRKAKKTAVVLKDNIDQPFMQQLERKNENIHFLRIDAEITDDLTAKKSGKVEEELAEQTKILEKIFKKTIKKDNITVKADKLKNKDISSLLTVSEESRRMQDMMKMYASNGLDMGGFPKEGQTLILNTSNKLVQKILADQDSENSQLLFEQLYDLARLQNEPLDPDAMTKFVARSNKLLSLLA